MISFIAFSQLRVARSMLSIALCRLYSAAALPAHLSPPPLYGPDPTMGWRSSDPSGLRDSRVGHQGHEVRWAAFPEGLVHLALYEVLHVWRGLRGRSSSSLLLKIPMLTLPAQSTINVPRSAC
jgi:hypothetical protein